jgi:TonB-dependent SusC/RagA subfamily outer membrane receptor
MNLKQTLSAWMLVALGFGGTPGLVGGCAPRVSKSSVSEPAGDSAVSAAVHDTMPPIRIMYGPPQAQYDPGKAPLIIIDGAEGGDVNSIDPESIKSIDILKDEEATAAYGERGQNGVILIETGGKGDNE